MDRKLDIPPPVLNKDNNISNKNNQIPRITSAIVDESHCSLILLIVPVATSNQSGL